MSVGRNDPCPCGSGKKYKKCCLAKDEAARPAVEPAWAAHSAPSGQPVVAAGGEQTFTSFKAPAKRTPAEIAADERWKAFRAADPDGRLSIFEEAISSSEALSFYIYEMFEDLQENADTPERRARLSHLMERLRDRHVEAFGEVAWTYLSWRLTLAINEGAAETEINDLATRLGECASEHIDTFHLIYEQLAWHSKVDALVAALRAGWPAVRESDNIFDWAIDEYANKGVNAVIMHWLDHHPDAREMDEELRADIAYFWPDAGARLDDYVARMAGWTERGWGLSDFQFLTRAPEDLDQPSILDYENDEAESSVEQGGEEKPLVDLTLAFISYAHRDEGVSRVRANLFRRAIFHYLLSRHKRKLVPREDFLATGHRRGRKAAAKRWTPPQHVLLPEQPTFELFLVNYLHLNLGRLYTAAVCLELLPTWLRFLESLGLVTANQNAATSDNLMEPPTELLNTLRRDPDPALAHALDDCQARTRARTLGPQPRPS